MSASALPAAHSLTKFPLTAIAAAISLLATPIALHAQERGQESGQVSAQKTSTAAPIESI